MSNRALLMPIGLMVLTGSVFLLNLGGSKLWDDDEPKNASCGREMLEQGNWVVPTFNHELRPHKPVLLYWGMIVSYMLVGVSEFGARLPSAIASLGTVFLCYQIGKLMFDKWTGFAAGVLLTCAMMFAVLSRAATPDAVLIFCVTLSFYCFVFGVVRMRGGAFGGDPENEIPQGFDKLRLSTLPAAGMYAAMGLAVLAKGPVGFLLPMTVICMYVLFGPGFQSAGESVGAGTGFWKRSWLNLSSRLAPQRLIGIGKGLRLILGAAVVLLVALPWYTTVTLATEGEWLTGFIGTHNVNRFLNPMEGHEGPFFYYVVAILAGFFPGSVFLGPAVVKAVNDQRKATREMHSQAFLLMWIGTYLVFFSMAATKLPNYIVPCFPALALLVGCWVANAVAAGVSSQFWLRIGVISFATTALLVTIALGIVSSMFWQVDAVIIATGMIPVVGGFAGWIMLRKERIRPAMVTCAASFVLFTALATSLIAPRVSPYQTSPRIAHRLSTIQQETGIPNAKFATLQYTKPNLVFYLGQQVPALESPRAALDFVADNQDCFLVMPAQVYERLRNRLPKDMSVLQSETKFMKPEEEVVVVGRSEQIRTAHQSQPTYR